MHLVIEMRCDGSSFEPDPLVEIKRIFKELYENLDSQDTKSLKDLNGNPVGYLSFIRPLKTMKGWKDSVMRLSQYLQEGDEVDDELVDHFLGVVPPATHTRSCIQMGEPYSQNYEGHTYLTLEKIGIRWIYTGIKNKLICIQI